MAAEDSPVAACATDDAALFCATRAGLAPPVFAPFPSFRSAWPLEPQLVVTAVRPRTNTAAISQGRETERQTFPDFSTIRITYQRH